MTENKMIKGSIVALVTPMLPDGSIEWGALAQLVDWHVTQKTNAIVVMGTTGESATLDFEEHTQVVAFVVKQAAGRIPVIAGTGANATSEAIRLTQEAATVGADACLLVTPYYNKPTQAGLVAHYQKIADSVDIPQILYNVPGRTACDMLPETVLKLVDHVNIVGIKEATGDLIRAEALIKALPEDFAIYSGDDETAKDFMLLGGHGNISVTANLVPQLMSKMCSYALAGDATAAEAINIELLLLNKKLFVEANPVPVKWAMHRMGLIGSGIRLPLMLLSDAGQQVLEPILQKLQLLETVHV